MLEESIMARQIHYIGTNLAQSPLEHAGNFLVLHFYNILPDLVEI